MSEEKVRTEEYQVDGDYLVHKVKELVHEGNIRRIIIKNEKAFLLDANKGLGEFQIHSHGVDFYRINSRFEASSIRSGKASYKLQDVARLKNDILLVNSRKAQKVLFVRIVEK